MVREIVGTVLVGMVYVCGLVIVFGPTLYVVWLYVIGRKVEGKAQGLLRMAYLTFFVNLVVAYFLMKLAFEGFLTTKVAEWHDLTVATVVSAVASEERFFRSHGRYYGIGPVRGPFRDQNGLSVGTDVILEVVLSWDHSLKRETFQAHAVHVLAKKLVHGKQGGKLEQPAAESAESLAIKSRLFNSVK